MTESKIDKIMDTGTYMLIICGIILSVLMIAGLIISQVSKDKISIYDVNHDGVVTEADANLILDYSVGNLTGDYDWFDVNGDGEINSADALEVLQHLTTKN